MSNNSVQKERVLVVDDNPKNLQVLAALLSENNYSVEVALNGKTALKWLNNTDFDAILLDVMMPEMNGFKTCELIKANPNHADLPVIFLTARHDIEGITEGFAKGGVDYITKPFNQQELMMRLKTHIELKKSREKLLNVNNWLQTEVKNKTEELIESNNNLIVAYEELKQLDRAKNDFLNTISHELRTPLNGIVGSINLLNIYDHDEHIKEIITLLEKSVHNLEKYSYSALQISNLQLKGESQLSMEPVDIIPLLIAIIQDKSQHLKNNKINTHINCSCQNAWVNMDLAYMQEALTALIECSYTFTPKGDIKIDINANENRLEIIIKDKGSLFSDTEIKHFFRSVKNQNYQFERSNTIEIYLAKIVILLHKGNITFHNEEDQSGTYTILNLPLIESPAV